MVLHSCFLLTQLVSLSDTTFKYLVGICLAYTKCRGLLPLKSAWHRNYMHFFTLIYLSPLHKNDRLQVLPYGKQLSTQKPLNSEDTWGKRTLKQRMRLPAINITYVLVLCNIFIRWSIFLVSYRLHTMCRNVYLCFQRICIHFLKTRHKY